MCAVEAGAALREVQMEAPEGRQWTGAQNNHSAQGGAPVRSDKSPGPGLFTSTLYLSGTLTEMQDSPLES